MLHAGITGNRALFAACIARYESYNKQTKEMVTTDRKVVAEKLVADELAKAQEYINTAKIARLEGEVAVAQAEGRSISTKLKVELGMARKELAAITGNDPNATTEESQESMPTPTYQAVKGSGADPEAHGLGTPIGE